MLSFAQHSMKGSGQWLVVLVVSGQFLNLCGGGCGMCIVFATR